MTYALGVNDDVVSLTLLTVFNDIVDNVLLIEIVFLGKKDVLRAVCDTAPECDVSGVTTHNLDDGTSLMR